MDHLARLSDVSGRWKLVIALTAGLLLLPTATIAASNPAAPGAPPVVAPFPGAPFPQRPNFAPQRPIGPNNAPNFGPQGVNPLPQQPQPAGNPAGKPADAKPGILGGAIGGAIAGGIGGALLGLVLWALRKTANTPVKIDPATGGVIAEYAPGLRYLMYAFSAFTPTVLLIVAICMPPQHPGGLAVVGVFVLLFAVLGGAVSWGLARARAIATDRGIISSSGFRGQRSMLWSDVGEVSFLKSDAALVFKSTLPNARPIKLGLMMAGLKPFTEEMRKHVPSDRYAKASEALQRIDQLTAGAAIPFMGLGAKPAPKAKPTVGA